VENRICTVRNEYIEGENFILAGRIRVKAEGMSMNTLSAPLWTSRPDENGSAQWVGPRNLPGNRMRGIYQREEGRNGYGQTPNLYKRTRIAMRRVKERLCKWRKECRRMEVETDMGDPL